MRQTGEMPGKRFRAEMEDEVIFGAWKLDFEPEGRSFVADYRPGSGKAVRALMTVIYWIGLNLMLYGYSKAKILVVTLLLAVCVLPFPLFLWLGARRSYYRLSLDFGATAVYVEEVRAFGPKLTYEAPLSELILLERQKAALRFGWKEDPAARIIIDCETETEAEEVYEKLSRLLASSQSE